MSKRKKKNGLPDKSSESQKGSYKGLTGPARCIPAHKPGTALTGRPTASRGMTLAEAMAKARARSAEKLHVPNVNTSDMLELWQARVCQATRRNPWPLTNKQRGQMSKLIHNLGSIDCTATLEEVINWAVPNWGEAICLSTPWLLRSNQRTRLEKLISKPPELSYFLYWAAYFFEAYQNLYYGEGSTRTQLSDAQVHQRFFERAMSGEMPAASAPDYASRKTVQKRETLAKIFDDSVSRGRSPEEARREAANAREREQYQENLRKAYEAGPYNTQNNTPIMTEEELLEEQMTQELDDRYGA